MISEKTVELNLTAELLRYLEWRLHRVHFAVGATQAEEAKLGFDVGAIGPGSGVLIQYKRAYVSQPIWTWKLNRTTYKDQHRRLQDLEKLGFPVFYAFPFFCTLDEVRQHRRKLLAKTFWYRPSQITPAGGPTGHHEVHLDTTANRFWVNPGDPVMLPTPHTSDSMSEQVGQFRFEEDQLERLAAAANAVLFQIGTDETSVRISEDYSDSAHGVAIAGSRPR